MAATAPTSLGESVSPRPRGSSGRVTAATTSLSRIWAARAGVPMKMIFSGAARSDADRGGTLIGFALLDHFLELAPVQLAFDAADPVDEELAVEMIYLVL